MPTVNISLLTALGVAVEARVIFSADAAPFVTEEALFPSGGNQSVTTDSDGEATVTLEPGNYTVTFSGIRNNFDEIRIGVPDTAGTYTLSELVNSGVSNPAPPPAFSGDVTSDQISDSTPAGRALLTAANATAQRVLLNLNDGTAGYTALSSAVSADGAVFTYDDNVRGWGPTEDSRISSESGLVYFDNSGFHGVGSALTGVTVLVANISDATTAGLTLLTGVTAAAQRVSLSLGNVTNTDDASKPVSTEQQAALDNKSDTSHTHTLLTAIFDDQGEQDALAPAIIGQVGVRRPTRYIYVGSGTSAGDWLDAKTAYSDATGDASAATNALVNNNELARTTNALNFASYTPGANGTFLIGGHLNVTAIATNVIRLQVDWTDVNGVDRTLKLIPLGEATYDVSTVAYLVYNSVVIRARAGHPITVQTGLTTSGGTMTFDVGATIQEIK